MNAMTCCAHDCNANACVTPECYNHRSRSRLTLEFFGDGLPEKKLQLIGLNILLILLSPRLGCYILTSLRDRRPRQSIPSQERPLLATSVCPVPAHVSCCVTTLGPHQPWAPCLRNCSTCAHETMRVGSDTIL
jgi:hypothetical protein